MPAIPIGICLLMAALGFLPIRRYGQLSLSINFISIFFLAARYTLQQGKNFIWMEAGGTPMVLSWEFSELTLMMAALVCIVNLLVQGFSLAYMAHDPRKNAYFQALNLFTASMLGIVFSESLLLTFLCWELVGFSSWLLIGFWYHKPKPGPAATKAFLLNRVADAAFLSGILILFHRYHSFSYSELTLLAQTDDPLTAFAGVLLLIGAFGKSAQFPFQAWLPDAMAGPTPASAMIHAATMVAAGVFLAARVSPFLGSEALMIAGIAGSLTALAAALTALTQTDIKKILAFSTLSQLGLMMIGIGSGAPGAALFHLFTHAFFKCGLFLGAAMILHIRHEHHPHADDAELQDIRHMRGLVQANPILKWSMGAFCLALSGIPLFSGFLSKEALLESMPLYFLIPALATVLLTPAYTFGLYFRLLQGENASPKFKAPLAFSLPLIVLALLSTAWVFSPILPWSAAHAWVFTFLPRPAHVSNAWLLPVSLFLTASGISYAWFTRNHAIPQWPALKDHFGFNALWEQGARPVLRTFAHLTAQADRVLLDGLLHTLAFRIAGNPERPDLITLNQAVAFTDKTLLDGSVHGIAGAFRQIGNLFRALQSGRLQSYLLLAFLCLILFLVILLLN